MSSTSRLFTGSIITTYTGLHEFSGPTHEIVTGACARQSTHYPVDPSQRIAGNLMTDNIPSYIRSRRLNLAGLSQL